MKMKFYLAIAVFPGANEGATHGCKIKGFSVQNKI